jgi:hypothetical protein
LDIVHKGTGTKTEFEKVRRTHQQRIGTVSSPVRRNY